MKKILIVEDEVIIGLDIAQKLKQYGYQVTDQVTSPQTAIEAIEKEIPDLMLLDINLKADIDGIELAKKIRQTQPIPCVYLTSYSDSNTIKRAMESEPYGYVIKPYTEGSLIAALSTSFIRIDLESDLNKQKSFVANILDNITDSVVLIDNDGVITGANKIFKETINCTEPEGQNISDLTNGVLTVAHANDMKLNQTTGMMTIPFNGLSKTFLISANNITDEDKQNTLLTMTDLTEIQSVRNALSDAEQKFTKIFREKMIPAALLNMPDMTIHEVNQAFFKLYEYDDSCVEMRADQIFGQAAAGDIASHMLKNESFKLAAVEQKKADGTKFIANITGKPVSLDDKTQSVLMDIQDITEQIRIAEMEKELQQKLIQANKMTSLGTLVSGVAHEINNPNNFIMFNNSLLMEFAEDAFSSMEKHYSDDDVIGGLSFAEFKQDIRKLIEGIENGSQRIKNIVHDLKGFTKKSDNEDFDSVNMENVISTSLRILNHQITNKTENFALDIQTPLPMVRGITQKLEQVFINIVMNALEAISGKSSMVKVESYQQDKKLIIKVTDEGLGISPENLSRITEPFFTTKQQDGGTGLGLSIVYSILDQHNGYMDIESEVGKGTTVTVSLPAEDKV